MTTTISPTRLAELRAMPYEEYLLTPEWLATRKRILKRDNYQCQRCHAQGVVLEVHHYTYTRLGQERDSDLVTLCEVCHDELHRSLADLPKIPFLYKCGIGLSAAAVGTIGIEGFLQAPLPAEIGVLVGAFLLAKNSPAIYGKLKAMVPPEVLAWLGNAPEAREDGKPSLLDVWLGRSPKSTRRDDPLTEEEFEAVLDQIEKEIEEANKNTEREDNEDDFLDDDETFSSSASDAPFRAQPDEIFHFSELLQSGWRPTWRQIFVGRTMEGKDIFVEAEDLCHVAIAGKTGGGKGSLMRLIMVQLCSIGATVVLLNPHYMRWVRAKEGKEFDEDWSPFEGNHFKSGKPYLKISPLEGAEFSTISEYLEWAVKELLEKRKREGRTGGIRFRPYFIVIDEWPSIVGKLGKSAASRLGELLREGRKFGIFVMVASQNFQVKTIGVEGEGGVRKCLLTVFYTGGDPTTAKELLFPEGAKVTIPEGNLGRGTIMMRCTGTDNQAILAHVPFVDNESVYTLLGPSTFHKAKATEPQAEAPKETTQIERARPEAYTLTFETITAWFDTGRINEKQFFALASQLVVKEDEPETEILSDPFDNESEETKPQTVPYVPPPPLLRPIWKYEEYYPITQEAYRLGYTGKRKLADFICQHCKPFKVDQVSDGKALMIIQEMRKRGMLQGYEEEQEHAE